MRIPQEKVLSYVGLDAFMLLRYIRFCRRVCLFSGILNVIILVPLYLHGDPNFQPDKTYIWRRCHATSVVVETAARSMCLRLENCSAVHLQATPW